MQLVLVLVFLGLTVTFVFTGHHVWAAVMFFLTLASLEGE